jgi:hypothetical protein
LKLKRQSASLKANIPMVSLIHTSLEDHAMWKIIGLRFLVYENLIRKLESRKHNRTRKSFQVS